MLEHHGRPERFTGNADLARRLADVADALADCDHLPAVDTIALSHRGVPLMGLSTHRADVPLAHAQWAATQDMPVTLELRGTDPLGTDRLRTEVTLRGIRCEFDDPISREDAERCLKANGVELEPGKAWRFNSSDLLSALDTAAVAS